MSSGFLKRLLLALLGILLAAVLSFAVILHNAFQATEDGARINSDTLDQQRYPGEDDREPARFVAFTGDHLYRGV